MKKHILAVMMTVAVALGAYAQNDYSLLVNMVNGTVVEYAFEYCPVATFDGNELVISDDRSTESMRCNMADVNNMTIKKPTVGVTELDAVSHLKIRLSGDSLLVAGLSEGAEVTVFDMSGVKVASALASAEGTVVVNVSGLGKGVFVASMPGNSFKFVR